MTLRGIEFQLIWYDQHVVEFRFIGSNGEFCGQAEAYLGHDDIHHLVERLKGFPAKSGDVREFELGTFDPKCAGGGLRLRLSRLDSVGHSAVDLELRNDGRRNVGTAQSVRMRIPIELAALDAFVLELGAVGLNVGTKAHLRMAC